MKSVLAYLSIPGLRHRDLPSMPSLAGLANGGCQARLVHSFPAVTWPTQCAVLTGKLPNDHGVVANGFYWRAEDRVEMWTAWNKVIQAPQIWDKLAQTKSHLKSAAWFPMLSKGSNADFVCMPAPIHRPDGSEDLWCYTKPQPFYGQLLDQLGHFPLQHFWGPLAGIQSSKWIADSAVIAAHQFAPQFWYIYLPHLDYAAQKNGPDSREATTAINELDDVIRGLAAGFGEAYDQILWIAASEYVITQVEYASFPNRVLRSEGLLCVAQEDGEHLDTAKSAAWAMVDHQFSHVFVRDRDPTLINKIADLFKHQPGFDRVLVGDERGQFQMDHSRSGDVILISERNSWQAYYWWLEDSQAPPFARTVDIHRKPGYDPVELCFDPVSRSIPLDASLIHGSHGAPVVDDDQKGVVISSQVDFVPRDEVVDLELHHLLMQQLLEQQPA